MRNRCLEDGLLSRGISVTRRCSMVCYPLRLPRTPKMGPKVALQLTRFASNLRAINKLRISVLTMKPSGP